MCYKFQRISYLNFSEILRKNCEGVPIYLVKFTARKTIFSFSRRPEKMVFPKKSCWNMIFLTLLGKIMFLFPENDLTPYTENERWWSFSKKYMEIWYFLQTFWNDGLFKKGRAGTWSFLYYLERWYFFPENTIFFPWAGGQRRPFSRNTWKYDIFVWALQTWCHALLPKKSKMVLSRKNILDCYPRKSPSKSLYFHGDLYGRFHVLPSSEKKNQET